MRRLLHALLPIALVLSVSACELGLPTVAGGPAAVPEAMGGIVGESISTTALASGATEPMPGATPPPARPLSAKAPGTKSEPPQTTPEPEIPPEPVKTAEQMICERKGGVWVSVGDSGARTCVTRTKDAGKTCRREKDCESACLARSQTCAPFKPLLGCNEILQDDGRRVTLCID